MMSRARCKPSRSWKKLSSALEKKMTSSRLPIGPSTKNYKNI